MELTIDEFLKRRREYKRAALIGLLSGAGAKGCRMQIVERAAAFATECMAEDQEYAEYIEGQMQGSATEK